MQLRLLGTTGYHPSERRHTACLLLPEIGVVLDAGTGFFRAREHLQTASLDIFLTHAHLDHVIGLTYLFDVLHEKPVRQVNVWGNEAQLAALERHLFAPELFPVRPPFAWKPLTGAVPLAGEGQLSYFPLAHPGGSLGFRLDFPGRSLAYVTDTTADPAADYVERIRGVDVLVHECYFPDGHEAWARTTGHSCTTPVAQVAAKAEAGRLILVHANPLADGDDPIGLAAARRIFPAAELGYDGQLVEF